MSGILKAGPHSYGHWRSLVQAAAFAAAVAVVLMAPASARTMKLVALGDSLTAGYGVPPGKAFPDQLQAALRAKGWDVTVVNAGVSGDTAEDGLARYDWAVPPDADALIVELGANDMLRGLEPARTKATLAAILERAKAAHLPTLLAGMRAAPNLGADYDGAFDAIYPALAKSYDAILYPFFLDGVAGNPKLSQPDGLHPTAAGVAVIVTRILPTAEDLLQRPKR
jgi:acyl-CoA thioesterase I